MAPTKKTYKFPKAIGACADKLFALKAERLTQQKLVDAIEAEEKALKAYIIDNLPKSEASGVAGKLARVTAITKEVPQVEDWTIFYKHLKKTGQFELIGKRLSDTAIRERWEAGKEVPGIKHFTVVTLSLNKI